MQSEWSAWLAAEKAAGRFGEVFNETLVRDLPWYLPLYLQGDFSADAFKVWLRPSPDSTSGSVAATVSVGAYEADFAGRTTVMVSLTKTQVNALPADGDADGLAEMLCDVLHTPAVSGRQYRLMAFAIPISGKVTDGD